MKSLTHLERLESESIDIFREAAAECERPVMLYSIGKDSSVLLHLARKAFHPSRLPFPLLHVDTPWKFREMIEFRDTVPARYDVELIVHVNREALERGIDPFTHGSAVHTEMWKTQGLKQALHAHGFDAAIGGARRDEERSRAKERVFSFRSAQHRWDPRTQRPELWRLYNVRKAQGESFRIFPLSNWTEFDVWEYIHEENIPVVPLYFARPRPVVVRDGTLIMVDDDRMPLRTGESPSVVMVRFRTLGCYPLSGAIESGADTPLAILRELESSRVSERQGRVIDRDSSGSMAKKKVEGGSAPLSQPPGAGTRPTRSAAVATRDFAGSEREQTLRLIACGSVDAGKSTLMGRMLYETNALFDDELVALRADSKRYGTQGDNPDFALVLDGLMAEREQGMTIDVAYRFFSFGGRHFIVADAPGHEQYTQNMVTGASTAELAVIVVDARHGVLRQTRRHTHVVALLGIRSVVLAINKIDTIGGDQAIVADIEAEYRAFARRLGLEDIVCIPLSALTGANVTIASADTSWYRGPALLEHLASVRVPAAAADGAFRMPVQWINRPDPDFRGYSGRILGGSVRPGDRIRILPAGHGATVARIVTSDGDLPVAVAGRSVTLTLRDPADVGRGDTLASADDPPVVADQLEATIIWMSEDELLPGRQCLLKIGARTVGATVAAPKYKLNVDTLDHLAAKTLRLNEIGVCNVTLDRAVPLDAYAANRDTGGFILVDRLSNATLGAGLVHFELRRSQNLPWQSIDVDKRAHAAQKSQRPCIIWFTGLSGAGKSTIANALERKLHALGRHTYVLDGDNVRHGLNKDLGFTAADRVENVRRVAEVAKLMVDAGLIVMVALISPFRAERQMARKLVAEGEFCEVFVDTPMDVAEQRDPKGLYAKARRGELANFTGIDSPYERPEHPELSIDTTKTSADEAADRVIDVLRRLQVFG